jgi:serine/threonine protein phosphatase 1
MLRKLFRARPARAAVHTIPAGQRVYAIGDVHGRLDLLDALLAMIDRDDANRGPATTTLILLGDLVDRGPDSAGVVERARRLAEGDRQVRLLKGNHEEIFLDALAGDDKALRLFCRVGGRETSLSYGIDPAEYESLDHEALQQRLAERVPEDHRTFLDTLEDMVIIGDYAFVHAGVRPDTPLDQQRASDLRWIRGSFLEHRGTLEKMIVHGHTIEDEVQYRGHRIGIDTGAYETGRLTALALEEDRNWLLQT